MKTRFLIEVEECKAKTVTNLLADINVKVDKPAEKERHYIHFRCEGRYVILTKEQYDFLIWLTNEIYDCDWEEVDPDDIFEEI